MTTQYDEVWQILYPRVSPRLSKGYCNGLLNPQKDKFFAATYITELSENDLEFLVSQFGGGYTILSKPSEPVPGQEGWHMAPPGTGLQPAACKAYSVNFHGVFYEGEWCIIQSLIFFETGEEELAKDRIFPTEVFNNSIYLPFQASSWPYGSVGMLEFVGAPYLVALVKQPKKEKVNWAFRNYLDNAVLQPLAEKLRIHYPGKYDSLTGLYGSEHFSSIFPVHKRSVLLVTGAKGLEESSYTIKYLLYMPQKGNIYEWEYFPPGIKTWSHDAKSVTDQLKTVTYWDNSSYLDSSCTLDDDRFWEQYVFLQENGGYKYLRELTFNGDSLSLKL